MNDIIDYKKKIKAIYEGTSKLVIFTAASCNLHCKYCYHNMNPSFKTLDNEIVASLKNGKYIDNCVKTLNKLGADPLKITDFEMWGGETLLHADLITENIPRIMENFPNIIRLNLTTNFLTDINKTIEMLKTFDKYLNFPTYLYFQTSIDGPDGPLTENGHIGKWSRYNENFEKLILFLNTYKLKKIKNGAITIKGTIDQDTFLEYFSKDENILKYMEYLQNTYHKYSEMLVNEKFRIGVGLGNITYPLSTISIDKAIEYGKIAKKWDSLKITSYLDSIDRSETSTLIDFYTAFGRVSDNLFLNEEIIDGCLKQIADITMLPDGTLTDCTVNYMYSRDDYLEEAIKNNNQNDIRACKFYRKFFINPLKMDYKELYDALWEVQGAHYQLNTTLSITIGMINELALSGFIPYKFHSDKMEQLRAAKYLLRMGNCIKNHVMDIGNPHIPSLGHVKLLIGSGLFDEWTDLRRNERNSVLGDLYTDMDKRK